MTRTERATYPRAIVKDRSESKSGLDKRVHKNGAGAHGWGALADEVNHELNAAVMEEYNDDSDGEVGGTGAAAKSVPQRKNSKAGAEDVDAEVKPTLARSLSDEERQAAALKVRKANSKDLDLGSIARTSYAVAHSAPANALPVRNGSVSPPIWCGLHIASCFLDPSPGRRRAQWPGARTIPPSSSDPLRPVPFSRV
ncbi:hypothetical protein BKA62DRAFT_759458 [Auriculariales sp. MPI-PUGE-AT-0066]|nr:hypothetical protein BKA62DRAFT_759458 [Auriculariales sp. MPI-PUGE-AT-0066]